MRKSDLYGYLLVLGVLIIISPLVLGCFEFQYGFSVELLVASGMYLCLMVVAILMLNYLNHGSFSFMLRWTKWDLYEENVVGDDGILVDVYVKCNLATGVKKYKQVVKVFVEEPEQKYGKNKN